MTNFRHFRTLSVGHQGGVVLFLALIALVAMSLAAVALIRSVDTSTLIIGNLAFKQSATNSGDSGPEGAILWLMNTSNASTVDPWTDTSHPFNNNNVAAGYYSSIQESELDPDFLFKDTTWETSKTAPAKGMFYDAYGVEYFDATLAKQTGNTVRYIIQRMCRDPNTVLSESNCLFSDTSEDNRSKRVLDYGGAGGGNSSIAGSPIFRVTARVVGPRNNVSFIQAFVY